MHSFPRLVLAAVVATAISIPIAACGPRQVEVRTAPQVMADVTLRVTNNLPQALNVYVVNAGTDVFLKQVQASSTESVTVPGIARGSSVTLKATPADGSRTYTRDNVILTGTYDWQVP